MTLHSPIHPRHVVGLDALRFLAAMLVVAYHYGFWFWADPAPVSTPHLQRLISFPELFAATHFGWVGVQIFFVISGFVIAFSSERAGGYDFLVSRVVRLGPGVWICACITLAAVVAGGEWSVYKMLTGFLHSVLFIPVAPWIDYAYWTLGIEIFFYFLVFLLVLRGKFSRINRLAIAIGLVSTTFWLLAWAAEAGGAGQFASVMAQLRRSRILGLLLVHHGIFFALGVLLWLELVKRPGRENRLWCVLFCAAGCLQIALTSAATGQDTGTAFPAWIPVLCWLGALAWVVFSVNRNHRLHALPQWCLRLLKTAGMMTFPLYLLHQVAGAHLMSGLVQAGAGRWLALAGALAFSLCLAWLVAVHGEPALQRVTKQVLLRARPGAPGPV
ncbi:acyltransferase family protein [Janthinobacterium sp. Mn2066]|uniref:acyltransferase family protein n=1 Tax=Janthinobacterium sp. Mn2066 TaxID=3395264 RepID=UPI003BDB7701